MEAHWRLVSAANRQFNLTAIEGEAAAAEKHYLDSLLPLLLPLTPALALDLGSGAGFPGLPLAICRPDWNWILLDSQEKRCKFLKQAVMELGLSNCQVMVSRAEEAGRGKLRGTCDLVTARAVASLALLAEYALPLLKTGGCFLALKGPALGHELGAGKEALTILGGEIIERREFVLPFCFERRSLLLIKKFASTPEKYPRRLAAKKPIVSRETS
ncbi:MAG: 16S rRNA (guanine(527)-N(7))-methyltransferase RsmG [Clostridiales bacterium]|jgi:16S rRNA (guanine527-N7)-methyltransferase|nr:16S rRNA (guanine(527)-N(7))-methyltransferase RsmG [Clostridiales bacterium]